MTPQPGILTADTATRLRAAILADDANAARLALLRRIEGWLDLPADRQEAAMTAAATEPDATNQMFILVMAAQRRDLAVPDGEGFAPVFQALWTAWQEGTLPPEQRRLLERNWLASQLCGKLRTRHPALATPPPPDPLLAALRVELEKLRLPQQEAEAHTTPGAVTAAWLDRLGAALADYRALLETAPAGNPGCADIAFFAGHAAYALGRGRALLGQLRAASAAYAEAALLYTLAGETDQAETAAEQATLQGYAALADVDGASLADLRRLADGVPDPLARARVLARLAGQASDANDQYGAVEQAEAAMRALGDAGFPDPESGPIAAIMAAWVASAIARRHGRAVVRLLQRIGEIAQFAQGQRHAARLRTDPAGAAAAHAALLALNTGLLEAVAQPGVVAGDIHAGLLRYMPGLEHDAAESDTVGPRIAALLARVDAVQAGAGADDEPTAALPAEAAATVAEAEALGIAASLASARHAQASLLLRLGDLAGGAAAAAAGEAALLPDGAEPASLGGRREFDQWLMLRDLRLRAAATARNSAAVLDCAEGAIAAIEAVRGRISDPLQQGAFLAERTRFYEMAAFAAFKLERWESLLVAMDLFKARSALRNRLAPPPDEDVAALEARLAAATAALARASDAERPALAAHRRLLWSLLSVQRLRGAAGRALPELTIAAVQSALAADEAAVAWVWVAPSVLIVLALDATRVHAERIILTDAQTALLAGFVAAAQAEQLYSRALGRTVEALTLALLPPDTRAFVAAAKRLILSPHRTLHLLPFHAARIGDRFLIELAAVRYVPNLGSLLLPWQGSDGGVVALGIDRFAIPGVPVLANAEAEAQAVASAWSAQGVTATTLIGPAATRAGFAGLPLSECRCLHLATHGTSVFDADADGDPFASHLLLQDGSLDAMSIAQLPLRAEFVVLSACYSGQRALGIRGLDRLPGDDIFGLQAALFQAGARSVIGALWLADDAATALIVSALHRRLAAGAPVELALQAALCEYLARPDARRDIFFWAFLFLSSLGRLAAPVTESLR